MKTLYESILSSTKSGAYSTIKKWCEDHLLSMKNPIGLVSDNEEHGWMIDKDMCVTNWTNGKSINTIQIPSSFALEIPSYIKFKGNIDGNFMIGQALNYMKDNQLPKECDVLYISGLTKIIPSFKIKCNGFYINDYSHLLEKIEPIELEMYSSMGGHKKPIINLSDTKVDLESVQNIKVTDEVNRLNISNTPASEEIKKFVQKHRKDKLKRGECQECEEYFNEIFKNLPKLRYIELSSRSHIEWNERMQKWYIF